MARPLDDMIAGPPVDQRREVKAPAARLIEEEMTLRDLRKAHALTQERIADAQRITQDGVSRIEKRSDFLLSTLRSYVEAMGAGCVSSSNFLTTGPSRSPMSAA